MGKASRDKGSRGELEVAAVFQRAGFDARRTPNSGGLSWRGDVQGVPGYVLEVKRCERLSLPSWLEQAYAASSAGDVPVVIFRQSSSPGGVQAGPRGRWHAVVPLEELARLLQVEREHTDLRLYLNLKKEAYRQFRNAFARGEIERGVCAECGVDYVNAHHEDYTKPLEVVWLCPKHHAARHNDHKYLPRKRKAGAP